MDKENDTVETEIHYSWIGYPKDAPETSTVEIEYGGDALFAHTEVVTFDDGSMALKVMSTGISSKYDLMKFMESVYNITQHDYLESAKESRE